MLSYEHRTYRMLNINRLSSYSNFVVGAKHLRDVFYRMGLSDKDIVALSGGHTLVAFFKDSTIRKRFFTVV